MPQLVTDDNADQNVRTRSLRLSEYPLVFVARDKRLFEVELPSFMYQSGTIGAIKATIDYWPIFQLGGTALRVR